jgi:hypothetical protein
LGGGKSDTTELNRLLTDLTSPSSKVPSVILFIDRIFPRF